MYSINNATIIGITGRQGKSSTAYLVHKYLKSIGKRSVLFSSCLVDSPSGGHAENATIDCPFSNQLQVINAINEAAAYEAEFIIFECWESSIEDGVFDNIPFDIKCLTLFFDDGDLTKSTVYKNKLKFFKDDADAICLFNITGMSDSYVQNFLVESNASKKVLYDSIGNATAQFDTYENFFNRTKPEIKKLGYTFDNVKYYAKNRVFGLEEQSETLVINNIDVQITTTLATSRHIENIVSAAAILNEANVFNAELFKTFISNANLQIPGRMEDIEWYGKTIIIDQALDDGLHEISTLKNNRQIVAVCSYSSNISKANELYRQTHADRDTDVDFEITPEIVNRFADYAIVTVANCGGYTAEYLTAELAKRLTIPNEIIIDRYAAIKRAIEYGNDTNIICIMDRGNANYIYKDYTSIEKFNDREAVEDILSKLN